MGPGWMKCIRDPRVERHRQPLRRLAKVHNCGHDRASSNAPSHRICAGRAVIGVVWSAIQRGHGCLSLELYNASFNAPIYANLFEDEGGEGCIEL
ncbi:DUF736 family protein [Bradyrhizobium sp. Pear77]|nr:DUF736 family protein [Bradyrhizobium altum]